MSQTASNLSNQQFGQLLALYPTDKRSHTRAVIWKCKCLNCENETEVASIKLKSGEIKSCGCMEHVREYRTEQGASGFNSLLNAYTQGARRRNLEFELSKEEFKSLVTQSCTYCGQVPSQVSYGSRNNAREHGKFIYNGVDRINSSIGYTMDNCVPCCERCNRAKMALSEKDFIEMIVKIYRHMGLHDFLIS